MRTGRARVVVVAAVGAAVFGVVVVRWHLAVEPALQLPAEPAGRVDSQGGDCGWTVPLGDGNVLWVVCDPVALPGGLTNSVAVTGPTDRTPPFQGANFVPPAPMDLGRCSDRGGAASWIDGVTAAPVPNADITIITAFFIHGCRESMLDGSEAGDIGVATYPYRHGATGDHRARVLEWSIFPGEWSDGERNVHFGRGAVYHDGHHHVYGCRPDESPDWVNEGQCSIARAARDAPLHRRPSWEFWRGADEGWVGCTPDDSSTPAGCSEASFRHAMDASAALHLPLAEGESPDSFTPQQFSVSRIDALGLFVAAAPRAFADPTMRVWVAEAPEGPWSAPGEIALACDPGEIDDGFNCYHVAAHPALAGSESLLFHFHDFATEDLQLLEVARCDIAGLADQPCP